MQKQITSIQKLITFSSKLYDMAQRQADEKGLSFPEYMRFLIAQDLQNQAEKAMKNSN